MSDQTFVSAPNQANNKVLWYVLIGVVVVAGLSLAGLWFYGNSLVEETAKPAPTPRPVVNVTPSLPPSPTPSLSPVPTVADINVVSESKSVVFPKAGRVYMYYVFFDSSSSTKPYIFDLVSLKSNISVQSPGGVPVSPKKMHIIDTGLDVAANESVSIQPYDFGNFDAPSVGWIKPADENTCGSPGHLKSVPDVFSWMRDSIAATKEPIVSIQCWGDGGPATDQDYNDFMIVLTYGPATKVAASPSPSASVSTNTTSTSTPKPSPSLTASPTPKPSVTTVREGVVDTSAGVPVTGVIEDTVKAFGIGAVMVVLGLLLL